MNNDNDLHKPLTGKASGERANNRTPLWAGIALLFIFVVPIVQFYDGFGWITRQFAEPESKQVAARVPETNASQQAETTSDPEETFVANRQHSIDPDAGPIQEVEPEGTLTPVTQSKNQETAAKPLRRQDRASAHLPDPELIERGATGVIPKKSADGLRAMDVYSKQPETSGNFGVARVVIVIGGLGISQTSTQQAIRELPENVTLAFAPYGNSLARWMQDARKAGHELLLQVPMEPLDYPTNDPGPHTLKADVDLQENLANLHWSMSRITNYVGITNYLGNKMLQQPAGLAPVFAEIANRGLLFFEDGSVQNSVGEGVALKELLPYARADILIDNVRSRSAIFKKLDELSKQAKRTGLAIGVGNAFPETISLVSEFARKAKENGIEITPVSAIVKDPSS